MSSLRALLSDHSDNNFVFWSLWPWHLTSNAIMPPIAHWPKVLTLIPLPQDLKKSFTARNIHVGQVWEQAIVEWSLRQALKLLTDVWTYICNSKKQTFIDGDIILQRNSWASWLNLNLYSKDIHYMLMKDCGNGGFAENLPLDQNTILLNWFHVLVH